MKKQSFMLIIFILLSGTAFAGGGGETRARQGQGPSGKLTIYTSLNRNVANEIQADLKNRFPDLEIDFFCSDDTAIRAKIEAEQAARKLGCDMVLSGDPSYSLELRGKRILQSYKSREASSLSVAYDKDGYWYPVWLNNMVLAYNPDRSSRRNVPESFYDFANTDLARGQAAMENPIVSGSAFTSMAALRDKYGYEYFEALGKKGIKFDSGTDALAKLESGEYRVIMIQEEEVLKKRELELSRLSLIYPDDGIIVIPTVIMTISDRWSANRNLKAAGTITDWFLSTDAQNYIVGNWMHSSRADFPKLPYDSIITANILERAIPINWQNNFRQKAEIRSRLEQFVVGK